jgi:MFS family permease
MAADDDKASPSPTASAGSTANKGVLGVAFLTLFLDLLGFGLLIPSQTFIAESLGAHPWQVTLLGTAYSGMQFLFAPFWGRLSDRVGRRPIVLISIAVGAVGFLIYGFATSLVVLYLSRALAGFGNANLGTVQAVVADVTTGKDRAKGMGIIGAAFGLGFLFGPFIGGLMVSTFHLGQQSPAFAAAIFACINWVSAFFLLKETHPNKGASSGTTRDNFAVFSPAALRHAARHVNVSALFTLALVYSLGFSLMEQILNLYVEHSFLPANVIGTKEGWELATGMSTKVMITVGLTAVVVQGGLIGQLRKRMSEKLMIIAGTATIAVSFVGLSLVGGLGQQGWLLMFPVIIVLSVGSGILSPSQSSLLSRSVPGAEQGAILGMGQSMASLGRVLGPAMAGILFQIFHGLPFVVGAVLIGVGTLVATGLKQPASDDAPAMAMSH